MTRRTVMRLVTGCVAGLALAAAATYGAVAPWPNVGQSGPGSATDTPRIDVTPVAAETVLACDGPIVALGRDTEDASALAHVSDLSVKARNGQSTEPSSDADLELEGVGTSLTVSQLPVDGESVSVAAAGSASVDEPDMRGTAVSACRPGDPESWIVGATVQTGVTDVLMLANASDVVATVSLAVYGVEGRQDPANGEVALAPHSQHAIPVASIAGGEQSPVIRVTSRGAPVRATLQSSRVQTLEPMGLDLQPGTVPARDSAIPGVQVTSAAADSGDDPTQLRLLGTGDRAGTVEVDVVDEESGDTVFSTTAELEANTPVSVGFDGLDAGTYTVRMTGNTHFVSAVRQTASDDYAWLTPEDPLEGTSLVAVPESPTGEYDLSFAALGDSGATVRVERLSGADSRTIDIDQGGSETISIDDVRTYRVTVEEGHVAGTAGVATDGAIAAFPLAPDPAEPEAITVTP